MWYDMACDIILFAVRMRLRDCQMMCLYVMSQMAAIGPPNPVSYLTPIGISMSRIGETTILIEVRSDTNLLRFKYDVGV